MENNIKFLPQDKGAFVLDDKGERIAEMIVGVSEKEINIYHTGVIDRFKGQGIGTKLIESMADYAREKSLTVIPHCPFVHSHFKNHPEQFKDIWEPEE